MKCHVSEPENSVSSIEGRETRRGNGDCGTGQGLHRSWTASDALGFTRSRPHRVGYWSSSHHYGAPVWDTGDPIVTQLRPWDRFCPQVLQSSVQHKVANIWPDEDPIFWLLRGRAGDS